MTTPEIQKELDNIPAPDTTNVCGHEAYAIEDELRLLSILNTLKLEPQFYKNRLLRRDSKKDEEFSKPSHSARKKK